MNAAQVYQAYKALSAEDKQLLQSMADDEGMFEAMLKSLGFAMDAELNVRRFLMLEFGSECNSNSHQLQHLRVRRCLTLIGT